MSYLNQNHICLIKIIIFLESLPFQVNITIFYLVFIVILLQVIIKLLFYLSII